MSFVPLEGRPKFRARDSKSVEAIRGTFGRAVIISLQGGRDLRSSLAYLTLKEVVYLWRSVWWNLSIAQRLHKIRRSGPE